MYLCAYRHLIHIDYDDKFCLFAPTFYCIFCNKLQKFFYLFTKTLCTLTRFQNYKPNVNDTNVKNKSNCENKRVGRNYKNYGVEQNIIEIEENCGLFGCWLNDEWKWNVKKKNPNIWTEFYYLYKYRKCIYFNDTCS